MTVRFAVSAERLKPEKLSLEPEPKLPKPKLKPRTTTTTTKFNQELINSTHEFPSSSTSTSNFNKDLLYIQPNNHNSTTRTISPIRRPSSTIGLESHPPPLKSIRRRPTLSHDGSSSHPQIIRPTNNLLDYYHHHYHPSLDHLHPTTTTRHLPITTPALDQRTRPRTHSLSSHQEPSSASASLTPNPSTSNLLLHPPPQLINNNNNPSSGHPGRPRSWVIPLNSLHPSPSSSTATTTTTTTTTTTPTTTTAPNPNRPPSTLAAVKKSLVHTIDRIPCSLEDKLILLSKLQAEVKDELTHLDLLFGPSTSTTMTNKAPHHLDDKHEAHHHLVGHQPMYTPQRRSLHPHHHLLPPPHHPRHPTHTHARSEDLDLLGFRRIGNLNY